MKVDALVAVTALILTAGCRPKQISGEMFIVSAPGINLPIGSAEVCVISQSEAESFMAKRASEIDAKKRTILQNWQNLRKQYDQTEQEAKAAYDRRSEAIAAFNTNADFLDLSNQASVARQRYNDASERYRNYVLHERPYPLAQFNQQQQQSAQQQRATEKAMGEILPGMNQRWKDLMNQAYSLKGSNDNYWEAYYADGNRESKALEPSVKIAEDERQSFPSVADYMDGFSPRKLDSAITSADGSFALSLKRNTMVFARVSDGDATVYWLVKPPENGQKLILSNQNMFTVPRS